MQFEMSPIVPLGHALYLILATGFTNCHSIAERQGGSIQMRRLLVFRKEIFLSALRARQRLG